MSWAWCQNNPVGLNFHLQKSLKFFEKNSADKIGSKKHKGIKVSPPVPNRVKIDRTKTNFVYLLYSEPICCHKIFIVNRIPCKKIMFTFPIMKTFLTWANVELNTVYILP